MERNARSAQGEKSGKGEKSEKGMRMLTCVGGVTASLLLMGAAMAETRADEAAGPALSSRVCLAPAAEDFKIVNDRWPDASSERTFALDAVRLNGAKTDQDKALAIWQWMRRCTVRMLAAPQEPIRPSYVDDAVKILNVYGSHHCDGLSRVMQNCWRALGYRAQKYYRNGHTYADCWWVDADGVGRYHTFDTNYGWFVFTRDGSRVATGEEVGLDFSLCDIPSRTNIPWIEKKYWMWAWVHAVHRPMSDHDMRLNLHPGETMDRLWDNLGRPYQAIAAERWWDDPDPRPYPSTYGNGIHRFAADLGPTWRGQLAAEPVNAAVKSGTLAQADPSRPAEVIYRLVSPYVIADVDLTATCSAGRGGLSVSTDAGRTWRAVPLGEGGKVTFSKAGPAFGRGPIGRYEFLLKVTLEGGGTLTGLSADVIVQQNFFALPLLLPGDNTITLSGRLGVGQAVEVTYVWDDPRGTDFTHTVKAVSLPFTYTVRAAGERWKDVRCRRLLVRAIQNDSEGNRVLTSPPTPERAAPPIRWNNVLTLVGPQSAPALRSTAEYVVDLKSDSVDVRRAAAAGLIVRRDPAAWMPLERLALEDTTSVKFYALQALYWTDANRAWPVMEKCLRRDASVKWPAGPPGDYHENKAPYYDHIASMISVMCAEARNTEAVPLLCDALRQMSWEEPKWAVLRSLGRLGDKRAIETVRRYTRGGDTGMVALDAAVALGDTAVIPQLKALLESPRGGTLRKIKAIEGLGRLGASDITDLILPYLTQKGEEDYRLATAEALGRVGDPAKAIPALEAALLVETFPDVQAAMRAALRNLRARPRA
jgi:HEAT repeat protein